MQLKAIRWEPEGVSSPPLRVKEMILRLVESSRLVSLLRHPLILIVGSRNKFKLFAHHHSPPCRVDFTPGRCERGNGTIRRARVKMTRVLWGLGDIFFARAPRNRARRRFHFNARRLGDFLPCVNVEMGKAPPGGVRGAERRGLASLRRREPRRTVRPAQSANDLLDRVNTRVIRSNCRSCSTVA